MNGSSVLIISDEPEFAHALAGRWQSERHVPEITIAGSDVWNPRGGPDCDLIVIGPVRNEGRSSVLCAVNFQNTTPAITVADDEELLDLLNSHFPQLIVVPRHERLAATLILMATEVLRRAEAVSRAQRAEQVALTAQRHATLGRYMLEMRPNVNNALTSMLGNADLLLIEPGKASGPSREQLRAIHTMALRLSEIMQRFSSLATEMWAGETASQCGTELSSRQTLTRS